MEITGWETGHGLESAQSWFEKGEAALSANRHSEAAECFGQVLKADPFNAKAHGKLSNVYWAQGKTEDALNCLTKALELEPSDRDTIVSCGRVFRALGKEDFYQELLQSYMERNPWDSAIRSEIESSALSEKSTDPNDPAELFRKQGETQFERGNVERAIACFEMAIENNPKIAEAYNNLGVVYLGSGKINEALENFYKALDLKPEDPEIIANSARALAAAGQIDTAIDMYREYLRRFPDDRQGWSEFESLIRRTVSIDWRPEGLSSEVAKIYVQMSEMLGNAGDFPGAAEAVERALKITPQAPGALFVLASLHNAIGQKDEAAGILDQALMIDPAHLPSADLLKMIRNGNGAVFSAFDPD